ncbi:hypothetical protein STRAU_6268 [Streptomyces aurantiacus JA 4570]|uniref:Uncharacterized protein n=1 Tax=Streptomyces aurantiacus JA 4570 TaxID=1286094 RepID=S3ZAC9_9ACTN|nr:hypothetical protein STRAU_6268 [Streptomyces aurantiacus JA 4570]
MGEARHAGQPACAPPRRAGRGKRLIDDRLGSRARASARAPARCVSCLSHAHRPPSTAFNWHRRYRRSRIAVTACG